jgi:predicted DNA-binding transcriptional regulator
MKVLEMNRHSRSKALPFNDELAVYELWENKEPIAQIAYKFSISVSTVARAVKKILNILKGKGLVIARVFTNEKDSIKHIRLNFNKIMEELERISRN